MSAAADSHPAVRAAAPAVGLALVLALPLVQAATAVPGLEAGLLFLAPALLLGLVLFAGRYPGERVLCAARACWCDRRRRVAVSRIDAPARVRPLVARGPLVLAHHIAVRPPPASLLIAA